MKKKQINLEQLLEQNDEIENSQQTWREMFFASFDNDKTMSAYYKSRKISMSRVYILLASAKGGHIVQIVAAMTYNAEVHRSDDFVLSLYPYTDEGTTAFEQALLIALIQHVIGISLFVVALVLLHKKLSWARMINPVILTFAFVLETPIYPVY